MPNLIDICYIFPHKCHAHKTSSTFLSLTLNPIKGIVLLMA